MKPVIGIVGRPDIVDDTSMIKVNDKCRRAVILSGGIPLLILPTQDVDYYKSFVDEIGKLNNDDKKDLIKILDLCDGIIMPGGVNVFEHDRFICNYCIIRNKPVLGICLGMQIMSYYDSEYSLLENDEGGFNHNQKDKMVHEVIIKPNTKLSNIVKDNKFIVNSKHKYHVSRIGEYIVSAISHDGLIEAIEYPHNDFNIGVQWHPEDLVKDEINNKKIFVKFINSSKKAK